MVQRFSEDKELQVNRVKLNTVTTNCRSSKKKAYEKVTIVFYGFTSVMKRIKVRVINDEIHIFIILSALLHNCERGQNIVTKHRQAHRLRIEFLSRSTGTWTWAGSAAAEPAHAH
jgi:hypothetical protein